ncbi:MAG: SCP2 sterol-binding domain-containing protein [Acidimicrobiales bacterium]|jgi:hypothetical protein
MGPVSASARPRPDGVATFFEDLVTRGHQPLLRHTSGTVRLDLRTDDGVEHWLVTISKGDISVTHRKSRADASIGMERKLFEKMAKGSVNLNAAMLRGVLDIDGNLALLMAFDRLLPGPRRSRASFLERQEELAG